MNTLHAQANDVPVTTVQNIVEDRTRLRILSRDEMINDKGIIVNALKDDRIALVQDLAPNEASELMFFVAKTFNLTESLDLQAAFASSLGHRENVGKYYMSVNKRRDYQFVCPHSEGGSFSNLQLASFYCYENNTDGGETILFNTNQASELWSSLKEKARRGTSTRALTPGEVRKLKMMLRLNMPEDTLRDDDEVISKNAVAEDFFLYEVLTRVKRTYSKILEREMYTFWTTVESVDLDSLSEFYRFLVNHDLLKNSPSKLSIQQLDDEGGSRIRHLGSQYDELFKSKLTHKLKAGEFIVLNNLSWTHAVTNWTPNSGQRKVVAAFA